MLENEIDKLVARYNLSKQELLNSLENQTRQENEIIYDIMLK